MKREPTNKKPRIFTKIERKALQKLGYYCQHKRAHRHHSFLRPIKDSWFIDKYGVEITLQKSRGLVTATCKNTKCPYEIEAEICTDEVTVYKGDDVDQALEAIDGFLAAEMAKRVLNPDRYERKRPTHSVLQKLVQMKSAQQSKSILDWSMAAAYSAKELEKAEKKLKQLMELGIPTDDETNPK